MDGRSIPIRTAFNRFGRKIELRTTVTIDVVSIAKPAGVLGTGGVNVLYCGWLQVSFNHISFSQPLIVREIVINASLVRVEVCRHFFLKCVSRCIETVANEEVIRQRRKAKLLLDDSTRIGDETVWVE